MTNIENMIKDSISKCLENGIKPTSKFWNVYPEHYLENTTANGVTTTTVKYAENAAWKCLEKNICDPLECLLLVCQPQVRPGMFHIDYLVQILEKDHDWIQSLMGGLDNVPVDKFIIKHKDAFELGLKIRSYLRSGK